MNLSLVGLFFAVGLSTLNHSAASPQFSPPAFVAAIAASGHPGDDHPKVGGFSSDSFVFKTVIADDGKDVAAGWQAAVTTLRFLDWRSVLPKTWTCRMRYEVPLRTARGGPMSPAEAASIMAEVATEASVTAMKSMDSWPVTSLYCIKFQSEMLDIFRNNKKYNWIGARVVRL